MTIIYQGPSLIDGQPIIVVATTKTRNRKTGALLQTWIMRADMDPVTASRTGADYSICGDCPHRGKAHDGPKGQAKNRSCYVTLVLAPTRIWKGLVHGIYDRCTDLRALGRDKLIRIGSYGDGAAVPQHVWDELCAEAKGYTAYTHQNNPDPHRFMTSVESAPQAREAWGRGERTFRVVRTVDDLILGSEILCPASDEAGKRTTCADCLLCAGHVFAKNIAIVAHGKGAQHWI